jgi:hypothetical protein
MQTDNFKPSTLKASLNSHLLLWCAFIIFCVQHAAFATKYTGANGTENHVQASSNTNFNRPQKLLQLPLELCPQQCDMEITDDDDRKKSTTIYAGGFSGSGPEAELHGDTFLKTRLLQITTSANSRQNIPLFILHHSWKCDFLQHQSSGIV